jgi:hypothetical protein
MGFSMIFLETNSRDAENAERGKRRRFLCLLGYIFR